MPIAGDIALDVNAGKMYWTAGASIQWANLDGSEDETVFDSNVVDGNRRGQPKGIALDVANDKMYWTDHGNTTRVTGTNSLFPARIRCANLDGSNVEDLVTTGLVSPEGIALDVPNGKMYWVDRTMQKVQRANLDGSNVEDLIINRVVAPDDIALDVSAGKMYWTDTQSSRIRRTNLDGTNLDGSDVEDLVDTGNTAPRGISLDVSAGKMYWTEEIADKIRRADLDGTNQEDLVTGLGNPYGIALHVSAGKMYWTDFGTDKIQRASLSGDNMEDLVTTNLVEPRGIALDVPGNRMYWTDFSAGKIQRADLDGTNVEDLVTTEGGNPGGIALHVPEGKMYWTFRVTNTSNSLFDIGFVRRSDLDGSDIEDLVTTGLTNPGGIALELEPSDLAVSPAGIDFGTVVTGAERDTTFTLTNTSPDTLRITGVTTTDSVFTVADTTLTLAPGDTAILSITFAPANRGEVNARVTLTSDAPSSPHIVGVRGEGRTVQTVAITTDTSTVVYQDDDGTEAIVTFTGGQTSGHTLTVETFGTSPPSSVQSVPPFSSPVFYVDFTTTIPDTASFEATVTFTYTDAQLDSAGITQEDSLKVAWFYSTTQAWSVVTGVLNASNNTITFTTDHFSVYALAVTG